MQRSRRVLVLLGAVVILIVAAPAAPATTASPSTRVLHLTNSGRIEVRVPDRVATTRIELKLAVSANSNGIFIAEYGEGRPAPGQPIRAGLMMFELTDQGTMQARVLGNEAPLGELEPDFLHNSELVLKIAARVTGGWRTVLVFEGQAATLSVKLDPSVRLTVDQRAERRVSSTEVTVAGDPRLHAAANDVLRARGTVASAVLPCGKGVGTALFEGAGRQVPLSCPTQGMTLQRLRPGATANWTLTGNWVGGEGLSTRLLAFAVD